jgi:hypothetical protein
MADREKCIPAALVGAEARAAAHEIRAIAVRLQAMILQLPLPPEEELDELLERRSEEAFAELPLLGLFVDIETLVRDQLLPAADALEEAGRAA